MLISKYQVPYLRQKDDVSISLSKDLLRFIDEEREKLGLKRSPYIEAVLRKALNFEVVQREIPAVHLSR